ncbi:MULTISPECIES: DUF397 domain-containing protein [unclassified Solwaraspora]|uniref:DUF397 domain-containing protein n=1 Tax=unclassified Solwaraspora TaxID=2627926 RepID=UPI00248D30EB|nr:MULTISPECIES: DUF397 domain-containing protein [unclassified Solwaraspora]WBB98326.1 DUF397 domain-containing protein [Solwaraspora sp. WMMA2059]WBC23120.1 DUF397 domain-containing protein [Solwaraspora sp. WMMA2080]WJK34812.1 DUF397 domain-containing protein [Solwaraspora sp. WMMA2065]
MELTEARWRKSTRSDSANCVEVADNLPGRVYVRDTKNRDGGSLAFAPSSWSSFVELAKAYA